MLKLDSMPLAMTYVPWQKWQNIYKPENALCAGTIFQELDLPFTGRRLPEMMQNNAFFSKLHYDKTVT